MTDIVLVLANAIAATVILIILVNLLQIAIPAVIFQINALEQHVTQTVLALLAIVIQNSSVINHKHAIHLVIVATYVVESFV